MFNYYLFTIADCKNLAPIWTDVANTLKEEQINVAKVDCTVNKSTAKRFDIRG